MTAAKAPGRIAPGRHRGAGSPERYDILILDGADKQSLTVTRSLARAGLRVAVGESAGRYRFGREPASFRSRYAARTVTFPAYAGNPGPYVDAVIAFAREHQVSAVLPVGDASVTELAPHRARLAELGCMLAVASDAALAIASDKHRTLQVAAGLGIAGPRSVAVHGVEELRRAQDRFGYPFVLKPTVSWPGEGTDRVFPVEVADEAEATEELKRFLSAGCEVLAQELATGRREGVTLLLRGGEVQAVCVAAYLRTTPPIGGVSVVRETIAAPADILGPSVDLARAVGLDGPCEVEWRRDGAGRPLLMEINARLPGSLEIATCSGADVPLALWWWATGQPARPSPSYRAGVRSRWLGGDLRWLWESHSLAGRPDTVPLPRAAVTFLREFTRTWHYDFADLRDLRPALAAARETVSVFLEQLRR